MKEKTKIILIVLAVLAYGALRTFNPPGSKFENHNTAYIVTTIEKDGGIYGTSEDGKKEFYLLKKEIKGGIGLGDKFTVKQGKEEDEILEVAIIHTLDSN